MLKRRMVLSVAMIGALAFAGVATAQISQNVDFYTSITDTPDPVEVDGVVSFVIEVGNNGPAASPQAVNMDLTLPMGVPMAWTDYLALDEDARNAVDDAFLADANFQIDDSIWDDDESGIYMGDSMNNGCEGLIVQSQSLVMPAGANGAFYYEYPMPSVGGVSGVAYAGPDGELVEMTYGRAGCNSDLFENCGNGDPATGWPCMGTPLTVHEAVPAPITFAGDGCQVEDFDDFPTGNVALIERGDCYFYVKAGNATAFGASAVIIGNYADVTDTTPTHDSVMAMGCTDATCHSFFINPSAHISYNNSQAILAMLNAGEEVIAYLGVRDAEPEYRTTVANLWSNGGTDTNPDNNRSVEKTTFGGGELAPVAAFTVATEGLMATFTDASTGGVPTSWAWDFGDGVGTSTEQNPVYTYAAAGTFTVTLTATNDAGSSDASQDVTVEAVVLPPVAGFTYTAEGMTVTFTDASTGADTWAWDFGDGSTSTEQNPVYTYGGYGTFTVSQTVSNTVGTDMVSMDIVLEEEVFDCTPIYVAAAGVGAGAPGSMWATDLGLNNLGSEMIRYAFQFLPRDTDNTDVAMSETFTLDGNMSVGYANIWGTMAPAEGFGSINVCVDHADMAGVNSRTYNTSEAGTFGQSIIGHAAEPVKFITMGMTKRLGFLSQNDNFRTNVGFMSGSATATVIMAEFFTADGTSLGTQEVTVPPYSSAQWTRAFELVTSDDVSFGYVDVWSETDGAYFLAYASIVDNMTGDPTTIWPFDDGSFSNEADACTPVYVAAAGSGAGAPGSMWSTDLGINNLGPDAITYKFQLLPRGTDNTDAPMTDAFSLGGNMSIGYADIWSELGAGAGFGALNVCFEGAGMAGVNSRTLNTSDAGTFGQSIVGHMAAPAKFITTGMTKRIGFLSQNDAYRTNVGFTNGGANAVVIMAEFFTNDGTSLGTAEVTVPPFSNAQWTRAFELVTSDDVSFGYVDVWSETDGAYFLAYGSIVDNMTGDPTTVWPF